MAVLQKLRTKFGVAISIIVGLGLLSFIIDPSQITSAINSMSSKFDVGKIAGKRVSYTDFQQDIERYTTINELMTGSSVQNEEQQRQIRDAAWQELVDKYMFLKNAKAAGIRVGDDEMVDLVSGDNVSPILAQNAAFVDENGNFSVEALNDFISQVDADETGQLRTYWNYVQNTIYTQQFYAKYGSLFSNGNYNNALQLADDLASGNTTADIEFVSALYPYTGRDSSIVVSDNEIRDYYKNHKNFFKTVAGRDIEYVVYEVVPSNSDIEATSKALDEVYEEFTTTDNMKSFLLKNSEMSLSDYWYKAGELATLNSEIDATVFGGSDVTPIIRSGIEFYAARVMDSQMISDSVYVKHILLQGDDAKTVADSLLNVVSKGGNFANLAAQYSADQGSAADGEIGNIGWMTQTYMIPGMESVLTAQAGKPFILNTQYGTHVVLVSKKTAPIAKKQVAILQKTAIASKETFNEYYSQANTFATLAGGTYEGYKKALDSTKVYSHPMSITEATSTYGSIDSAKEVTRWAFDNKKGKASNIITVNNNYFFVVANKDVRKEGFIPVEKMATSISDKLYNDKLKEKMKADVAAKIAGLNDIQAIADALGTEVETRESVSFSTLGQTVVEPALVGAAMSAQEGVISGPVAGQVGVYVFKVSNKNVGEFYTADDANTMAMQKAQYASQMIIPAMQEAAKVVDNRERFF